MKLEQYKFIQAKNYSSRKGVEPTIVVLHYTAGRGDAERTARFFARGKVKASAHFAVSRDGDVVQCVDTDRSAWHAGKSDFRSEGGSTNRKSIGIEICGTGWNCEKLPEERVGESRHRNPASRKNKWEIYPEAQIEVVKKLCQELKDLHPSLQFVTGHEDVRNSDVVDIRGAKTDPGPLFPWDDICWESMSLEQWHWSFKRKIWYNGKPID